MRLIFCALIAICLTTGCNTIHPRIKGSGIAQTEQRPVAPFNEVELSGFGTVNVVAGYQPSVHVTADDNLLCKVETYVEGQKLKIKTKGNLRPKTDLVINVTVPELAAARVSGAGDLNVDGVYSTQLDLSISGAGDVRASGQVNQITAKISGAGSADLQELQAEHAKVKISGAGDIDVFATDSIDARVSGAGSVNCFGKPQNVKQHVSGVGSIHLR